MEKEMLSSYLNQLTVSYITGNYLTVDKNWHDYGYTPGYNKFYLIEDGQGWLKIGSNEIYPTKHHLVYMPANITQSYDSINSNYYTKYWCHFTAHVGDKNIFEVVNIPYMVKLNESQFNYLSNLFSDIYLNEKSSVVSSSLKIKANLLKIIIFLLDNSTSIEINITNELAWVDTVLNYIEANITKELNIKKLANVAHLHPNYFIKQFKDNVGISPITYINNRRVKIAQGLLINTKMSITEIASKVGVKDSAYFSKVFKASMQLTPREYRKIHNWR